MHKLFIPSDRQFNKLGVHNIPASKGSSICQQHPAKGKVVRESTTINAIIVQFEVFRLNLKLNSAHNTNTVPY